MLVKKMYHKIWEILEKHRRKIKYYETQAVKVQNVESILNFQYGESKTNNTLNLHFPKNLKGKLPTIIVIHGGGYVSGKKEGSELYSKTLAKNGVCVINMEYSRCDHSDKKYFLDQLADVFNMFDYIKNNKEISKHIDFDNIFLAGDSAGAHIASMVASIQTNKLLNNDFCFGDAPKIKGLVLVSPVFGPYGFGGLPLGNAFKDVVFGKENKNLPIIKNLHTLNVMSKDFPPTIMFSMPNDFIANPHKNLFCSKAKKLCIPVMHYTIKKGYKLFHSSLIDYPTAYPNCIEKIINFVNDVSHNKVIDGVVKNIIKESVKITKQKRNKKEIVDNQPIDNLSE